MSANNCFLPSSAFATIIVDDHERGRSYLKWSWGVESRFRSSRYLVYAQ